MFVIDQYAYTNRLRGVHPGEKFAFALVTMAICLASSSFAVPVVALLVNASATLIRRALEPAHMAEYGFEEIPWIARETKRLYNLDPELAEDIYHAVFSYNEDSVEKTSMGSGKIIALTSTKNQDYESARYSLAEDYTLRQPQIGCGVILAIPVVNDKCHG